MEAILTCCRSVILTTIGVSWKTARIASGRIRSSALRKYGDTQFYSLSLPEPSPTEGRGDRKGESGEYVTVFMTRSTTLAGQNTGIREPAAVSRLADRLQKAKPPAREGPGGSASHSPSRYLITIWGTA